MSFVMATSSMFSSGRIGDPSYFLMLCTGGRSSGPISTVAHLWSPSGIRRYELKEQSETAAALGRAGRRAVFHLLQAAVEGLKAVEAVIEEIGSIGDEERDDGPVSKRERIEIE